MTSLVMCAFALLIDGYDVFIVGAIAPALAIHFHVTGAAFWLVFLLQQLGIAVGSITLGPVSDRFGRKRVLLLCSLAFGLLTLAAIGSRSVLEFAVLRGLAGIFLGGVIPNAIALLLEETPRRRHGLFVSIAFTGYAAGAVAGAVVGALLLGRFGWAVAFWIGGLTPLVYVAFAYFVIAESAQFRSIDATEPAAMSQRAAPPSFTRAVSDVLGDGRALPTILIWIAFFLAIGTSAIVLSWLPTLFHDRAGVSLQAYSRVSSIAMTMSVVGILAIGYVLDRYRPTHVILVVYACFLAAMLAIGQVRFGTTMFVVTLAALIFFQGCGQTGINAIAAQLYPPSVRSTGIGFAFGAGRLGGIVGPLFGGAMIAAAFPVEKFFFALSVPIVLTIIVLYVLDVFIART